MKKILLSSLILMLSCSFSFGAVYNQDNRIPVPYVLKIIKDFENNANTNETALMRKNILHKLSTYGVNRVPDISDEAIGFIFHMIKLNIGESKFQEGLNKMADLKDMPSLTWLQILRCFDGIDADSFYDAYFSKNPLIKLTVTNAEYISEKGNYYITFTLLRKYGDKVVNIPYVVEYDNKKEYGRLQSSIDREETFKVPVSTGAVKLVLDPNYHVIRELADNEKAPVIADILHKENILYIDTQHNNTVSAVFKNPRYVRDDEVKFSDLEDSDVIIGSYNNKIAKFFADKRINNEENSEYFIFKNPMNKDKYILIANNIQLGSIHLLENYAFNQELIFKNDKLVFKSSMPTDMGITILEHKQDVIIDVKKLDTFQDMMKKASTYKTIFAGESHSEYSHHANQLAIIEYLNNSKKKTAIAMEMVQYKYLNVINDFVKGRITEKEMLDGIDYYNNWSFDYSLYAPIFRYARDNNIDIIPLNIDREVTSKVYQGQIDNLTEEQVLSLPERMKVINNEYENKIKAVFDMHAGSQNKFTNFFLSQNIWDEIMAKHLADYRKANPDTTIVVICGNGHAGKYSGIPLRYKRITGENSFVIMQGESINQERANADVYIYPEEIKSQGTPKIGVAISIEEEKNGIVKVESVTKNSPAAQAGIKNGDIILKCGYHDIKNIGNLKYALYEKGYDGVLECEIKRGKNILNKSIKLFEYDDSAEMDEMIKAHTARMKNK